MKKKNGKRKECYHRNFEEIKSYRKNYPYGRKSIVRYTEKVCNKMICTQCGKIIKY